MPTFLPEMFNFTGLPINVTNVNDSFVNTTEVTVQATCITLTAMSADRCYATVYPLKSLRHRTPRVAMAVSICIWIGSIILSIPIIIYQKIQEGYWYGPRSYCMEQFPSETHQKVFILYQFLVVYLLPLITISLCYSLMLKRVGQPVVEPVDNNYQLLSERTVAMRSKISKMVVVIVLLFIICWGPIQLFILFQSFYPNFQANYATYKIKTWANCMSYANSSINPIVYGFMGASFRKSFKKAFPFMLRRKNLLNLQKLSECVSSSPLTGTLLSLVDDAVTLYNATLTQIIDTVASLTTRVVKKDHNCPWYTIGLRMLKYVCRKLDRKWRSSELTVHREIWTDHLCGYRRALAAARVKYFSEITTMGHSKPNVLFKTIDQILHPAIDRSPVHPPFLPVMISPFSFRTKLTTSILRSPTTNPVYYLTTLTHLRLPLLLSLPSFLSPIFYSSTLANQNS
ncbi:UNVERIFIED_CONTAM: hypothetical protein FKN15_050834 [Acipenser sinensis]